MTTTLADAFNGIRLTSVRTLPGRETEAFHANIVMDGRKVGTASNDGNGGEDRLMFSTPAARQSYEQVAQERRAAYGDALGDFELLRPVDLLTEDLLTAALLSRMRRRPFLPGTETRGFWNDKGIQHYLALPYTLGDPAADARWLAEHHPGSRLWSKDVWDFVPVEDFA